MEWIATLLLAMMAVLAYRMRKIEERHAKFYQDLREKNQWDVQPKTIEEDAKEPVEK